MVFLLTLTAGLAWGTLAYAAAITLGKVTRLEVTLNQLRDASTAARKEIASMSQELDDLTAEVQRNTEVDQSAIALLTGLAQQIEDLKGNPEALQTLADTLRGSSDALAAAVLANTPQPPPAEG